MANGDVIMAVIARHLKAQGKLTKNLVVTTVMSNLGFRKAMARRRSKWSRPRSATAM